MQIQVLDDSLDNLRRLEYDKYLNGKMSQIEHFLAQIPLEEYKHVRISNRKQIYLWSGHFQELYDLFERNSGIKIFYHGKITTAFSTDH